MTAAEPNATTNLELARPKRRAFLLGYWAQPAGSLGGRCPAAAESGGFRLPDRCLLAPVVGLQQKQDTNLGCFRGQREDHRGAWTMMPRLFAAVSVLLVSVAPPARAALSLTSLAAHTEDFDFLLTASPDGSTTAWVNDQATETTTGSPGF